MIWTIFRKDLRLLRLPVAAVALAHLLDAAAWSALGPFLEPRGLLLLAQVWSYLSLVGSAALIAAVIQQDPLPDLAQDWLVRPIPRRALLAAKILFIALCVHLPVLVADLSEGAWSGLPFLPAMGSALRRSAVVILVVELPVLALASMTRSLLQAALAALLLWILVVVLIAVGVGLRKGAPPVFAATGLQWMTPAFWCLVAVATAMIVIPLQYFRRATRCSWGLTSVAAMLAASLSYVPWDYAFRVQRLLSADPVPTQHLDLSFDPTLGVAPLASGSVPSRAVFLPLLLTGLQPRSIVLLDRAELRIVDADGAILYSGRSSDRLGYGDDFQVRALEEDFARLHHRLMLPEAVLAQIGGKKVRLQIEYSLSVMARGTEMVLPAIRGVASDTTFGECRTELDPDGADVEFGCLSAESSPACFSATLESPRTGARNPETLFCTPDYAPIRLHILPMALDRFQGEIRFRNPEGATSLPVDGPMLGAARVRMTSYRPMSHLVRTLVVPEIRLGDWMTAPAQSPATAGSKQAGALDGSGLRAITSSAD